MTNQVEEWLKRFGAWVAVVTLFLSGLLSPLGWETMAGAYAFLVVAFVFAVAKWWLWFKSSQEGEKILKGLVLVPILIIAIGWGYFLWWVSLPHFEITALDTLESDKNAYELTDMLIWNQDNPDKYGVGITFTFEVRPAYFGKQRFGKVVAIISGPDGNRLVEKELWGDFKSDPGTQQIHLTLPELLAASGLKVNADPPSSRFRAGDLPFQQAKLFIRVARVADKTHPWHTQEITLRNAPWDLRADLVSRNGMRELDAYVKNLGGAGGFTIRYNLVRLERDIGSTSSPMNSGTTNIDAWNAPDKLVYLKNGQSFTNTFALPGRLAQGRYLFEVYPVKKQNYIQFKDPNTTWENCNSMQSPWWFGGPVQRFMFVVATSEFKEDPIIQAEWKRLKDKQAIDLGLAIGPVKEVKSALGTVGQLQAFQEGEIYVHDGKAYALYGPILDHYRDQGGIENKTFGFPTSAIQVVASSSGTQGTMMEFEGPGSSDPPTVIYASSKGVAATWYWINRIYSENGGYRGWLGFPMTDEQYYTDSTIQMFEHGYIVYYFPKVKGERDWDRTPVAFPYIASRGDLFDVYADPGWQNTGIQIQAGDRITIIQVDGSWTYWKMSDKRFDANGDATLGLQENATLPSATIGTLIGRIGGDDGQAFPVGRWKMFTSPSNGSLHLAMNDNQYGDNAGLVTVQIIVEHPK